MQQQITAVNQSSSKMQECRPHKQESLALFFAQWDEVDWRCFNAVTG